MRWLPATAQASIHTCGEIERRYGPPGALSQLGVMPPAAAPAGQNTAAGWAPNSTLVLLTGSGSPAVEHAHDRGVLEGREGARLLAKLLDERRIGTAAQVLGDDQHLERDGRRELEVGRLVDQTEAAAHHNALDGVAPGHHRTHEPEGVVELIGHRRRTGC